MSVKKILDKSFSVHDKKDGSVVDTILLSDLGWKAVKVHLKDNEDIKVFKEDGGTIWWKKPDEGEFCENRLQDLTKESIAKIKALRKVLNAYEGILSDKGIERGLPHGYIKTAISEIESIYQSVKDEH